MSTTALVMMLVYLAVVWGLLAVAAYHLGKTKDDSCGTLGSQDLDALPQYQTQAASKA